MNAEDGFLAALAQSPDDVHIRQAYADWLEERGDPRAAYLRVRCEVLGVLEENARRVLEERARELSKPLVDRQWVLFILTQDALCGVMRRCGGPLPSALTVLWRELIWDDWSVRPDGTNFEISLFSDHVDGPDAILERNRDHRRALEEMFRQIDFLGGFKDYAYFGLWRYAIGVKPSESPIIALRMHSPGIAGRFFLGGRTLQDFFSVPQIGLIRGAPGYWDEEVRVGFESARHWWSERGIETSSSLEALAEALTDFPDPQERFEQLCM